MDVWARARVIGASTSVADGVGIVALMALFAALTWGAWGDVTRDFGYDWIAADRGAAGLLAYEDFVYYYGPLGWALLSGAFAVFGSMAGTAIAVGLVLATLAVLGTYALALGVTTRAGALIAAALAVTAAFPSGNKGLVVPHSISASVAVVCSLAALLAAARVAQGGGRWWLALAGVGAGMVTLTRPEFSAAIAGALAAWLALRVWNAASPDRLRAITDGALCLGIALAIPVVVYGAIVTRVPLAELLSDNLAASDELAAGGADLLRISAPMTVASLVELAGRFGLYAVGAAALVGAGLAIARGGPTGTVVSAALALAVAAFVAVLIANPEAARSRLSLAYGWIPLGATVGAVCAAWPARRRTRWSSRDQIALLVCAFLAVLAAKSYAAFFPQPNPLRMQAAVYALPFAAVFLVWLHGKLLADGRAAVAAVGLGWVAALAVGGLALIVHDGRAERGQISGPGGTLAVPPDTVAPLQGALDAIVRRTAPDEQILLAPQLGALYTLSDRRPALRQLSLLPGALGSPADEADAIKRLHDVRLVVIDTRPRPEYGHGSFGETYARDLVAWVHHNFARVASLRGTATQQPLALDIWERR